MALDGTYNGLVGAIAGWLHRADLAADIPDFIVLAEARIARDLRLRGQLVKATLACTPGQREVPLPADYLESENLTITVGGVERHLGYVTSETADVRMPFGGASGAPAFFTVLGNNLLLGPTPDAAYVVTLDYYARLAALGPGNPGNFLLATAPGVYLWAALAEAAPFLADDPRAATWEAKYQADAGALQAADDEAARSGASMRVRSL